MKHEHSPPASVSPFAAVALPVRLPVWHMLLLLVVALATMLGYQAATPATVTADADLQETFYGLHAAERDEANRAYRWTNGDARVCFPGFGNAPRSLLTVTTLGDYALPLGTESFALRANGQPPLDVPLTAGTRHYTLLVNGQAQPTATPCVHVASDTVKAPADPRMLGIQVQGVTAARLPDGGLVRPSLSLLLLNSALALVVCWLLVAAGMRVAWAALLTGGGALLVGALLAGGVLHTGVEAGRNGVLLLGGAATLLAGGVTYARLTDDTATPERPRWQHYPLVRDLLLMLAWSVFLVGSVYALQAMHGRHGVWPLKAGVFPGWTAWALVALAAFAVWLALVLRRLRAAHTPLAAIVALTVGAAVALPVLLKSSVRGWYSLYTTFALDGSDYIVDVPRVGGDPLGFLASYVAMSPTLAWHNANHPPGSVMLLWLVNQTLGEGAVVASWVAILLSSLLVIAGVWLGYRLGGGRIALLAGALLAVMPGHTVYSVTSMDGIFNAVNGLAAVAFFLALEPGARPRHAALAGVLIAAGLWFTYATTQLFFLGVAVCGLALLRDAHQPLTQRLRFVVQQGATAVAVLVAVYAAVYLVSGFDIIAASIQAKANNARLLGDPAELNPSLMGLPTIAHYTYYLGVNIVPYLWYLAPWGLAALTVQAVPAFRSWRTPTSSYTRLLLALVALVAGMWLSGLFVREVERIWGFTYPLAAVLIAHHVWDAPTAQARLWRAGLWLSLYFAQSFVMRQLLNLYW